MTWLYYLRTKSDTVKYFRQFLADVRADGIPSILATVRSDNGGEFHPDGPFGDLCRERGIRQQFSCAMSPEQNGVVERALAIIEATAMASRIQARELFPGIEIPNHD